MAVGMSRQARATKSRSSEAGSTQEIRAEVGSKVESRCPICKEICGTKVDAICCELCEEWLHIKCIDMPLSLYRAMDTRGIHWFCDKCDGKVGEMLKDLVAIKRKQDEIDAELGEVKERMEIIEKKIDGAVQGNDLNKVREELDAALQKFEHRMQKVEMEEKNINENGLKEDVERVINQRVHTVEDRVDNMRRVLMQRIEDEKGRREREEIEKRRTSLVIHRMEECGSEEDAAKVETLLRVGLAVDVSKHLISVERIGKPRKQGSNDAQSPKGPRPIRIRLRSNEIRIEILKRAKTLRGQDDYDAIYITPDLTVEQQKKDKDLRDKLKSFREQFGKEGVKIQSGKVIRFGKNGDSTKEILYDPDSTETKVVN